MNSLVFKMPETRGDTLHQTVFVFKLHALKTQAFFHTVMEYLS